MEIICTQCGARLPQDNARYCNNCGSLIASRSSDPVSSSRSQGTAPSSQHEQHSGSASRPPLREQIAQQPPARPLRPSSPDHTPAWMSELERTGSGSGHGRTPVDPLRMKRSMEVAGEPRPADMREATVLNRPEKPISPRKEGAIEERRPAREQDVADKPTQAHVPAAEPMRRPAPPNAGPSARELRVKVWPQEDLALAESPQPEREQQSAASRRSEAGTGGTDTALDDLPTRPLVANAPTPIPPVPSGHVTPPPAIRRRESVTDDVERLSTTPLLAPEPRRNGPVSPANVFAVPTGQVEQVGQVGQVGQRPWQAAGGRDALGRPSLHPVQPVTPPSRPVVQPQLSQSVQNRRFVQQPVSPVPPVSPLPLPPAAPVQERGQEHGQTASGSGATKTGSAPRTKRSSRMQVMMLAVLAILIIGGLGTWIIVFHPFAVPAITQPQQTFSNTQLGFSVRYPGGWTEQTNVSNGTVVFSDSSHTGQVKLLVTAANGDPAQFLSKEAAQLGMTGVKQGNALSFAGSSWQQVQGSLQVAGANYSAVLLATVHGNHLYTLIQMAPQMTYTDEEQIIFSPMRASFRFLP